MTVTGTLAVSTCAKDVGVLPLHSLYKSGSLGPVAKLFSPGTTHDLPSIEVIVPTEVTLPPVQLYSPLTEVVANPFEIEPVPI